MKKLHSLHEIPASLNWYYTHMTTNHIQLFSDQYEFWQGFFLHKISASRNWYCTHITANHIQLFSNQYGFSFTLSRYLCCFWNVKVDQICSHPYPSLIVSPQLLGYWILFVLWYFGTLVLWYFGNFGNLVTPHCTLPEFPVSHLDHCQMSKVYGIRSIHNQFSYPWTTSCSRFSDFQRSVMHDGLT